METSTQKRFWIYNFNMAEKFEQIEIETGDPKTWVIYRLTETPQGYDATGYFDGPGKGDLMMSHVIKKLEQFAKEHQKPVTHRYVALTERSLKLIQRTEGYSLIGRSKDGHEVYKRVYYP